MARSSGRSSVLAAAVAPLLLSVRAGVASERAPVRGDGAMKIIHGSLKGLLSEVKDRKVDAVRVAALMSRFTGRRSRSPIPT